MNAIASSAMSATLTGVWPPEPPTPRLSKVTTWWLSAMPSRTFGSQSSSTP